MNTSTRVKVTYTPRNLTNEQRRVVEAMAHHRACTASADYKLFYDYITRVDQAWDAIIDELNDGSLTFDESDNLITGEVA